MTGWRVERSEDGEAVLTFGGLPFGQGFDLVACFGGEAPNAYAALADALARDAKVAEIVGDFPYGATSSQMVALAEEVLDVHRWTAP